MGDSRYGTLITFVGGTQVLLVFIMWIGTWFQPFPVSTWWDVNIQSTAFWLALVWNGMLLIHLGLGVWSDYVQFTEEITGHKTIIYSAVGMATLGLIGILFLSLPFLFQ